MDVSYHPDGSKKRYQLQKDIFPKTRLRAVLSGSKYSKIEAWRGAVRLLGASWAILASAVRPGRRLRPVLGAFWSRHGAY